MIPWTCEEERTETENGVERGRDDQITAETSTPRHGPGHTALPKGLDGRPLSVGGVPEG